MQGAQLGGKATAAGGEGRQEGGQPWVGAQNASGGSLQKVDVEWVGTQPPFIIFLLFKKSFILNQSLGSCCGKRIWGRWRCCGFGAHGCVPAGRGCGFVCSRSCSTRSSARHRAGGDIPTAKQPDFCPRRSSARGKAPCTATKALKAQGTFWRWGGAGDVGELPCLGRRMGAAAFGPTEPRFCPMGWLRGVLGVPRPPLR